MIVRHTHGAVRKVLTASAPHKKVVAKFFRDIPRHDGHAAAVTQLDRFDVQGRRRKTSSKGSNMSFKDAFA